MKKIHVHPVAWAVLAPLALLPLAGCQKKEKAAAAGGSGAADSSVAVTVAAVTARPYDDWGTYSADVRGIDDATLTAPGMGGRVATVAEVGKPVKAGQALCSIESERYGAALAQAEAALNVAKGDLDRAKVNVQEGSVGKAVLEGAQLAFNTARLNAVNAERSYQDSRCQAPFAGMLVSRQIEAYQSVAPGAPTVRIARTDRLEAVVAIPEAESRDLKEGQKAEFFQPTDPGAVYTGRLKSIDRAVEARSRTVSARIDIANPGKQLRPGMVGRVRVLRHHFDRAIAIPSDAVLRLQGGTSVMLARGGVAKQVPVELDGSQGDSVLVVKGLSDGDTLITTGAFRTSDGTKVAYAAPAPAPAPAQAPVAEGK